MSEFFSLSNNVFNGFAVATTMATGLTAIYSAVVALRGAVKSRAALEAELEAAKTIYFGDAEANSTLKLTLSKPLEKVIADGKPFETEALARYYNQALNRANISFWFSLTFASIGFGVIIFAFISYSSGDLKGAVLKVVSGAVIDAVSALFFTQSTASQRSMADFFEKLRLDRLNAEAREMISEIEKVEMRDQLRAQLILKYTGVEKLLVDLLATKLA